MRKLFTTLKSVVAATVIAAMTLAASCSYDDSAISQRVDKVEKDLAALTERVTALENRLTAEVDALKALIDDVAVVTDVKTENGVTTITLSDGTSFTIENNSDAADTTIAPYKHSDGVYYWAIFTAGEFVEFLEVEGAMVPVYAEECEGCACELMFSVDETTGNLLVSIDGGVTYVDSGIAASGVATGSCIFTAAVVNENGTVTFTLTDGSEFTVAIAELIEFSGRGHVYVKAEETKDVLFTINDAVADISIMNQPLGWKATVEVAPVDETDDEVDPGMGVMAAGGKEYVLKVTGPSKNLIREGIADKSGFVQVHFNTASGACKVAKLAVDLAELTLEVDNQGNITITNTLVSSYEYSDWWTGETTLLTDFNNYYAGVILLDDYSGDLHQDLQVDYVDSAAGYNTNYNWYEGYFGEDGTTPYSASYYEDGVCEIDVLKTSVEAYVNNFSYGSFGYEGESFLVFAVPTDMNTGDNMWEDAVVVEFKQLNVTVTEREDLRAWNNVYFDAKLRGGVQYQLNHMSMAQIEEYLEYGYAESMEDYFFQMVQNYLQQPQWASFGYKVTSDVVEEGISLNELLNWGASYESYFELTPATDYVLAIFAEEEGKTEYTADDITYVYFSTADIVEAETPFEYTVEEDLEFKDYFQIAVNVTVPSDIVTVYSAWYEEQQLELDVLKDNLIAEGWAKIDFEDGYTYSLSRSTQNAGQTMYLGLLMVDAEGNYTLAQMPFTSAEVTYNDAVLTIEDVAFAADGVTVTVGGLNGQEVALYKGYVVATDASSYYQRTEEQLQDMAYKSHWMYREYNENPFVVTQTADYQYSFAEGKTYKVAAAVQFADGTVSNTAYGEFVYEAAGVEPAGTLVFTTASAEDAYSNYYGDYKKLTLSNDTMTVEFGVRNGGYNYLPQTTYGNYWDDTSATYSLMDTYTCWTWDSVFDAANAVPTLVVSLNDEGKYKLEMTVAHYSNAAPAVTAVFEGDINGIGYEGEGGEVIETIELTSAVATAAGSSYIGGTGYNLTFSDGNGTEIVYMVQTLGHTYLKEGDWNDTNYSWSDEGYINSVTWTNVNTAWPYTMTVAVVDDQYDITLEAVDYYGAGQPTLTAHYAGQIEGFTLPGAAGEGGGEEEPGEVTTLTITDVAYSYLSQYNETEVYFTSELATHQLDFAGKMTETEFLPEGTYTTADNSLIGYYCYFDKNTGSAMTSATCVVTHTEEGCHFEVEMSYAGVDYVASFTYAPEVEEGGDDAEEGVTVMSSLVESAAADSYTTYFHFSDESGDNQVKFVCENTLVDETGFIYDNDFVTYQSSISYIFGSSHFSFVNKSLIVDGVTYNNSDVSNASAKVANGTITITFTVGGAEHVFQYTK